MPTLSRADNSMLGRWWWTVDRWTLGAIGMLIGFGYIMMLAASPAVAERIGSSRDIFHPQAGVLSAAAGAVVVAVSLLSPRSIRALAIIGCIIALALTVATMFIGVEIKGARRWIALPGLSVQPSRIPEALFRRRRRLVDQRGPPHASLSRQAAGDRRLPVIAVLLKSQPDVGMLAVISAVFFAQLYIDGLNLFLVAVLVIGAGFGGVGAYMFFPHVQRRVEAFLHPGNGIGNRLSAAHRAGGVRQRRAARSRAG